MAASSINPRLQALREKSLRGEPLTIHETAEFVIAARKSFLAAESARESRSGAPRKSRVKEVKPDPDAELDFF
jgi:hypothetical protein